MVPFPSFFPFFQCPIYLLPLVQINVPNPFFLLSKLIINLPLNSPTYFLSLLFTLSPYPLNLLFSHYPLYVNLSFQLNSPYLLL